MCRFDACPERAGPVSRVTAFPHAAQPTLHAPTLAPSYRPRPPVETSAGEAPRSRAHPSAVARRRTSASRRMSSMTHHRAAHEIPVLRPLLPTAERLLPYLSRIAPSRGYTNWGPLASELGGRLPRPFWGGGRGG